MKLGLCTSAFPGVPLPEVFERLADAGCGAVDIAAGKGHPCHPDAFDMSEAPALREAAGRHGLEIRAISAHTPWLEGGPAVDAALEFTNRAAIVASHLGAPVVVTNTGPYLPQCDRFDAWDAVRAGFLKAAAHAESLGVTLCLEPHVGHIVMTWESALKLIREVGSPNLRISFDAGQFFILGLDHRVALEQLWPYVAHVRLTDFALRRPPLCELRPPRGNATAVALGDGDLPLSSHIGDLRALGWDGPLSGELSVADPHEALHRSAVNVLPLL